MKKQWEVIALTLVGLALCAAAGTALYRWITEGDQVRCVANEFAFGCSTTLGWLMTAIGAVVFVGGAALWAHFRDR